MRTGADQQHKSMKLTIRVSGEFGTTARMCANQLGISLPEYLAQAVQAMNAQVLADRLAALSSQLGPNTESIVAELDVTVSDGLCEKT